MNVPVGHDYRSELQLYAEFLERDGHRGEALAGLHDGERNWPPARKLASLPLTAIRLGSARICSRFLFCSASITAPKLMSGRNRNRFRTLLMV